jgi:5,10-methylenetetrahydromethanopterin reductase
VMSIPPEAGAAERAWRHVQAGADAAGRTLERDRFLTCSLTCAVVLDPGEPLGSERVIREAGPYVVSALHYLYDNVRQYGAEPPPHVRGVWPDYCALVESTPEPRRHQRIHAGHCTYLLPEEVPFVTPELVRRTCLVGTADELVGRVRQLEEAGLHQLMFLPSLESQYGAIERFAQQVMARL